MSVKPGSEEHSCIWLNLFRVLMKFSFCSKDLVKRHDDDLNLKTPIGPEPHPSWVYRHNYSAMQSTRAANSPVKRSISMLNALKTGGSKLGPNLVASKASKSSNTAASTASTSSTIDRVELIGGLRSKSPNTRKISAPGKSLDPFP